MSDDKREIRCPVCGELAVDQLQTQSDLVVIRLQHPGEPDNGVIVRDEPQEIVDVWYACKNDHEFDIHGQRRVV